MKMFMLFLGGGGYTLITVSLGQEIRAMVYQKDFEAFMYLRRKKNRNLDNTDVLKNY